MTHSNTADTAPVYSHNPYHTTGFPLLVLNIRDGVCIPENEGFQMLHWHEEVQFVLVLQGTVHITVYDESYDLYAGDVMFLNRAVLHHIAGAHGSCYHSFLIPTRMLSFFPGSIMEQNSVLAITGNPAFTCCHMKRTDPGCHPVLSAVQALDTLYFEREEQSKTDRQYEYRLSVRLVQLWLEFITMLPESAPPVSEKSYERIRLLLGLIHRDYKKPLHVEDIAAAAHISKTECLRCFQKFVHASPYQYLIRYRLHMSKTLLATTDLSVTDIALETGFSSASSYIRYFRRHYQMTPSQYRKSL